MSLLFANSIASMDICDACPSTIKRKGFVGGMLFEKKTVATHKKISEVIQPLGLFENSVLGTAPVFNLSGTKLL